MIPFPKLEFINIYFFSQRFEQIPLNYCLKYVGFIRQTSLNLLPKDCFKNG